jgi:hypothetical protein
MSVRLLAAGFVLFAANAAGQPATSQAPPRTSVAQSQAVDKTGKVMILFEAPLGDDKNWTQQGWMGPGTVKVPNGFAAYVDPATLQQSFTELMQRLGTIFTVSGTTTIPGGFALDELEVHLALTAEGSIGILGTGSKLGAESGITVKLKRAPTSP